MNVLHSLSFRCYIEVETKRKFQTYFEKVRKVQKLWHHLYTKHGRQRYLQERTTQHLCLGVMSVMRSLMTCWVKHANLMTVKYDYNPLGINKLLGQHLHIIQIAALWTIWTWEWQICIFTTTTWVTYTPDNIFIPN